MRNRIEKDSLGEKEISYEAYYGIGTAREHENTQIIKRSISRQMIKALAVVKKAAAKANQDAGFLEPNKVKLIMLSCDEILNGRLHGQFITDLIQGGEGAGMHINANEVIANRANEMKGYEKGSYTFIDPLKDVSLNQSTTDVISICGKIASIRLAKKLLTELKKLSTAFLEKSVIAKELNPVVANELITISSGVLRSYKRIDQALDNLKIIHFSVDLDSLEDEMLKKFYKKWNFYIGKFTTENFEISKDVPDPFQDLEALNSLSDNLELLAGNLSKICNSLLFLSTSIGDNEDLISLPIVDNYSDNKYQTNILEVVQQVSLFAYGTAATVSRAVEFSYLRSHSYEPIILMSIFEMTTMLRRATRTLREKVIEGIEIKNA